jgi:hypothetical protein
MWISSSFTGDYKDFADDAFDISIANSWLDNLYVPNISNSDDQCPVAYVVGETTSDISNRLHRERYNKLYPANSKTNYWGAMYIQGCDPASETVITSDFNS